jgi:hypothetical protein
VRLLCLSYCMKCTAAAFVCVAAVCMLSLMVAIVQLYHRVTSWHQSPGLANARAPRCFCLSAQLHHIFSYLPRMPTLLVRSQTPTSTAPPTFGMPLAEYMLTKHFMCRVCICSALAAVFIYGQHQPAAGGCGRQQHSSSS